MKVLFVGLGGIGQRHLRNLVALKPDDVQIFAYRVRRSSFVLDDSLSIQEGESLEEKYHITVFDNLDDAWMIDYDAVFICNPSSLHVPILRAAIEHGCNVFVEKPVSDTLDDLDSIAEKIRAKNLIAYVGYQNRFHPCVKRARQVLIDRAVGRVVSVQVEIGENVQNWHQYEDYRNMYACRKDLGGGVILSQIHELDYLYSFFGLPKSVYAAGGKLSDLEIDVEDIVDAVAVFEQDGNVFPVSVHEDYLQIPPTRTCKVIGTAGRFEFDLLASRFVRFDETGTLVEDAIFEFTRNDMFVEELEQFLTAIEKGGESPVPLSSGMASLRMALALKESLEKGEVVCLSGDEDDR